MGWNPATGEKEVLAISYLFGCSGLCYGQLFQALEPDNNALALL